MTEEYLPSTAGGLLKQLRTAAGISQRQLADAVGSDVSLISRLERGRDARLSTWQKIFLCLGYQARLDPGEQDEETEEFLKDMADERRERQRQGLCTGKRRF